MTILKKIFSLNMALAVTSVATFILLFQNFSEPIVEEKPAPQVCTGSIVGTNNSGEAVDITVTDMNNNGTTLSLVNGASLTNQDFIVPQGNVTVLAMGQTSGKKVYEKTLTVACGEEKSFLICQAGETCPEN